MRRPCFLAVVLAFAAQVLSAQNGTTVSAARLRTNLFRLAADSMMGREPGSLGNARAADYVAAEFRRLGLEPAGDAGTYFQRVPLAVDHASAGAELDAEGVRLRAMSDFLPVVWLPGRPLRLERAQAIYGGEAADTQHWIDAGLADGKVVVMDVRPGGNRERTYVRSGAVASSPRWERAAAVLLVELDLLAPELAEQARSGTLTVDAGGEQKPVPPVLMLSPRAGDALFAAPLRTLAPGALGKHVTAGRATVLTRTSYPARNVVAILRGRDARLRHQYVSLTAHNDHVGFSHSPVDHDSLRAYDRVIRPAGADSPNRKPSPEEWTRIRGILDSLRALRPARPDSIRNGADDDGSGTVALLELARVLSHQKVRPRRSILFVSHTAEEYGLVGSAWFTDHPTVPLDSIVAEIDSDMIGRGGATDLPGGGPAYLEVVGAWRLSRQFGDLLAQVNAAQPRPFTFNLTYDAPGHPLQYYCRADHYNYARYGIPSASLSRGEHLDYHQVTDEPQYIDYDALARVTSLVRATALRLANEDSRPMLDVAKPDPRAPCRQ